jgi:hypothetical protein
MAEDTFLARVERMFNDMSKAPEQGPRRKKRGGSPLPDPGESEEEDILRPKDRMKGTGAMLRKRDSFSKMMGLEDAGDSESSPLPDPGESEEEDILRPKDRMKGTGAMLRKRDSFSKMMGLEDADDSKSSPLPDPGESEEEDILRPKDRMKGTGAMLRKRDSFSKMMGLEDAAPTDREKAPRAKLVAEDELMQSFFAKAHGGSFDPKSRVDKAKMQKILDMVNSDPKLLSLTPGKFAVKLYASK